MPLAVSLLRSLAIAVCLSALACDDLSRIKADQCGNGVVEAGEDCEPAEELQGSCGAAGTEDACFYVCQTPDECPAGWSCAANGLCYQGTGEFTLAAQIPVVGDRSEIIDFNGDGYDDLGVSSIDIIRFRFGPFIDVEVSEPVAATRGFAAADINGDGASDGLIGSPEGWYILLGSRDLSVGSSFHPSGSLGLGQHILSMSPVVPRALSAQFIPTGLSEGQICQNGGGACVALYASNSFIDAGFALDESAGPVAAAALGDRSATEQDVRVAYAAKDAASVSMAEVQCPGECNVREFALGGLQTVALSSGARAPSLPATHLSPTVAPGGVHFADLEGDGDEDLLVWSIDDAGNKGLGVLFNQPEAGQPFTRRLVGSCTAATCISGGGDPCSDDLDIKSYATEFVSSGGGAPGDLLAVGQIDGSGYIDLVTSTGIYLANSSGPLCGFAADFSYRSFGWVPGSQPWTEAVIGDLNGDGIDDVAAISAGIPQIEIYRGNAVGALTRLVLDTDQPPTTLSVGDLDADGNDDLIFAVDRDEETSDIRVRWGTSSGRGLQAETIGQSFRVAAGGLATAPSVSDLEDFDADAETFIAGTSTTSVSGPGQTTIAVVQGSANRALAAKVLSSVDLLSTAYLLDPETPTAAEGSDFTGRAWCVGTVVPGRFFSDTGSLDIATFGELVPIPDRTNGGPTTRQLCDDSTSVRFPILEGRRGAGNGNVDALPPWCEAMPEQATSICAQTSRMTAVDLDGDGLDELAIVAPVADASAGCSLANPSQENQVLVAVPSTSNTPQADVCASAFQPSLVATVSGALRRIERGAFDDQVGEDLIVITSSQIALLRGAQSSLGEPVALSGLPTDGCTLLGAHTLVGGCAGDRELAVFQSCDGTARIDIYSVSWSQDLPEAQIRISLDLGSPWPIDPDDIAEVQVGDVDGNGLDDLFARSGDSALIFLADEAPAVGSEDVCSRLD